MRTYKTDGNQRQIISVLREAGASVCSLASVGSGCPDLLVGKDGVNFLIEVKNPDGRGMRYTRAERAFMDTWRGRVYVATSVSQALELLNGTDR
jgi:Holliday junction resolvase